MNFDKPTVLPGDVDTIMADYPFGAVLACWSLGGIPNTTYRVETERRTIAVRIYSHGQSSLDHIAMELRVLAHLADSGFQSPRPLAGTDGNILQQWQGYPVCASEFIPGVMADTVPLTTELVEDVGRVTASLHHAMSSFKLDTIPPGETFVERGDEVVKDLDRALSTRGWSLDVQSVPRQWGEASALFLHNAGDLTSNVIHADIWPPNVICRGQRVVGLVDFDDCCYGATILDVAIALMEFSMFRKTSMNEDLALAFLTGYFRNGGQVSAVEEELLVAGMEMTCAVWLAYNVIQAPEFAEADVYARRLGVLRDAKLKAGMRGAIRRHIDSARHR